MHNLFAIKERVEGLLIDIALIYIPDVKTICVLRWQSPLDTGRLDVVWSKQAQPLACSVSL